jgi:glutathione S-transferase
MASHIVLLEAGLPFTLEKVDLRKKLTASGADYKAINPKGYVPALELAPGTLLTEGTAILQYLADQAAQHQLLPASGMARYEHISWLGFIATELHKNFSPLFRPDSSDEVRAAVQANLTLRFGYVESMIEGDGYLLGAQFSVADAYLFTVASWAAYVQFDMSAWPALQAYLARVAARPSVQKAMRAEGLLD